MTIYESVSFFENYFLNDGVVFVNPHKETFEKIVHLDRNVEWKIISLMNSELSDRVSKKIIFLTFPNPNNFFQFEF